MASCLNLPPNLFISADYHHLQDYGNSLVDQPQADRRDIPLQTSISFVPWPSHPMQCLSLAVLTPVLQATNAGVRRPGNEAIYLSVYHLSLSARGSGLE